jgi:hypothetical protein
MLYKPRFCCHCGDRVERVVWRFRDSRRFCDVCETDYVLDDWAGIISCVIFVFGFLLFVPKSEQPKVFEGGPIGFKQENSSQPESSRGAPAESVGTYSENSTPVGELGGPASAVEPPTPKPKPTLDAYCEAITKKGTPCTRKVKKGERCWQHKDK